MWRECYPFFEAFGRANGRKDAVVEILDLYESQFKKSTHTYNSAEGRWEHYDIPVDEEKEKFQKSLRYMLNTGRV